MGDMGSGEGLLPLIVPGREITTDTLLLAELAGSVSCAVCFDLGTGTGGVLSNADLQGAGDVFRVGVDISMEALRMFDRHSGQPVNCSVEMISSVFARGCADLVLANPPYNTAGRGRVSPDRFRQEARSGDSLLVLRFIFAGAHLLKSGGCMIITARPEALPELETGMRAAGFCRLLRFEKKGVAAVKGYYFKALTRVNVAAAK
jgi:tRNA1(Val) A37 N6-methylase TrmN6